MPSVPIVAVGRVLPVAVPAASAAARVVRMPSVVATGRTPSTVTPNIATAKAVRLSIVAPSIAAVVTVRMVSVAASILPGATVTVHPAVAAVVTPRLAEA
jgi:hypothetical protein